ncbi:MAG: AAA family ATPase [Spirochaetes bacterium]|nr:AAA family ATPase [Spirochaetota bacterium]
MKSKNIIEEKINLKEGERRYVTVLFTDMKNFTSLSQKLDPEELDSLMTRIFSIFESLVKKYDGIIEKYIGDALVAIFGAKKIHEDDPSRAINCALEMIDAINDLNEIIDNGIELKFRTGIHTGLVTVGKRGEFDVVTGDTLAIASRLQEAAEENSILVSEGTKEEAIYDFTFSGPIELSLKGLNQKIYAYKVTGFNYTFFNYNSPFIGRKEYIDKIVQKYIKFSGDKIDGFYITGEQGSGKTRLVAEFYKKIKEFPDYNGAFLYAKAGAFPFIKFGVILNLILNYLKISKNEEKEKIVKAFKDKIDLDNFDIINYFIYLLNPETYDLKFKKFISDQDTLSLTIDNIDPFNTLLKIIEKIFNKHDNKIFYPVIYIDSVDLIDKESRDFLRFLFDKSKIKPFFLLSSDYLDNNIFTLFLGVEEIQIHPLSEHESYEYIKLLLKIQISDEDIKKIYEATKGNPFFIEEYIRFINKTGNINQVPTTIQNLILASFDKYSIEIKDILYKCSVFRHSFNVEYLKYINSKTGGSNENIENILDILVKDKVLIFEKGVYRFRQSLIKDTLYNSLLIQNKKILHKLIAQLLMKNEKSSLSTILYHLINSEEYEEAKNYLLDNESALNIDFVNYIDKILQNLNNPDPDSIFDLLHIKFTILFNNGRLDEATETLSKMLQISIKELNNRYFAKTFHFMTSLYKMQSDYENVCFYGKKAIYYYKKVIEESSNYSEDYKLTFPNIIFFTSIALYLTNRKDEAISYANILPENDFHRKRFYAFYYFHEGYYSKGIGILEDMFNKAFNEGDELTILFIIDELVDLLYEMGNYEKLIEYIEKIKDRFPFNYRFLSKFYSYLGISLIYQKQNEKGFDYLKKAEYFANQLKNDYLKTKVYSFLAEGFYLLNDIEKALHYSRNGFLISIKNKDHLQIFEFCLIFLLIYIKIGDKNGIEIFLKESEVYADMNFIFNLKYKALFLYIKYKYGDVPKEQKEKILEEAYRVVQEKIKNEENEEIKKLILNIRFQGEILKEHENYQKSKKI